MDVFFKALEDNKSREEAMSILKTSLLKKKLQIKPVAESVCLEAELREILDLKRKKEILNKLLKK